MAMFKIPPVAGAGADRSIRHLNQIERSRRWSISPRSLERWRWLRQGPAYLKISGRVLYRLVDIEEFERRHMRIPGRSAGERLAHGEEDGR